MKPLGKLCRPTVFFATVADPNVLFMIRPVSEFSSAPQ
jgi:hypothetical protein